jgi:hypothetical protein
MAVVWAKDVRSRAQEALSGSPVYALRELQVERQGDTLVIQGMVSSFYHKQLAQEVIRTAAEGMEVVNSIQVR